MVALSSSSLPASTLIISRGENTIVPSCCSWAAFCDAPPPLTSRSPSPLPLSSPLPSPSGDAATPTLLSCSSSHAVSFLSLSSPCATAGSDASIMACQPSGRSLRKYSRTSDVLLKRTGPGQDGTPWFPGSWVVFQGWAGYRHRHTGTGTGKDTDTDRQTHGQRERERETLTPAHHSLYQALT